MSVPTLSPAVAAAPISSIALSPVAGLSSPLDAAERAQIDASTRLPVLALFGSAILWLLIASVLGLLASLKAHWPHFLDGGEVNFLTYGRVKPAHMNAFIYGWCTLAGLGVATWLMARLTRTPIRFGWVPLIAVLFWNIGLSLGITGIFLGQGSNAEMLEIASWSTPILFLSYMLMGVWGLTVFTRRPAGPTYISAWYLAAALYWFPWIFATVSLLVAAFPTAGVWPSVVNSFYIANLLGMWLTPIGLAAAYYFIPKVSGQVVHSYYLAALGFWVLVIVAPWAGGARLLGGPVPLWIQGLGLGATVLLIVPALIVAVNLHLTLKGYHELLINSPTLRFTVFGSMAYTVGSVINAIVASPPMGKVLEYTQATLAPTYIITYAFFSMVMFGAIYYIVPRLTNSEWRSSFLIKAHFWPAFYGCLLLIISQLLSGLVQGWMLETRDATTGLLSYSFVASSLSRTPFLVAQSMAWVILIIGHVAFFAHFVSMLFRLGRPGGEPTLFGADEDEHDDDDVEVPSVVTTAHAVEVA